MKYVFDITTMEHVGWIEDDRAAGRADWTDIAPPSADGMVAHWTGAVWELRPRATDVAAARLAAVAAVQARLDGLAQSWGYDSILSGASYAGDPDPRFAAEGATMRQFRSDTWRAVDAAGHDPSVTTLDQLIALLPPLPARPIP